MGNHDFTPALSHSTKRWLWYGHTSCRASQQGVCAFDTPPPGLPRYMGLTPMNVHTPMNTSSLQTRAAPRQSRETQARSRFIMLVCHISTPEELRNEGVGNPQDPQQDRASALSRTEERCGLRLPDHCVSVGWARPLLQAGRQNPEWQLPPETRWLPAYFRDCRRRAHSPYPSSDSKMACTHPSQGRLTLERTRCPAVCIPTLNQSESGVPWRIPRAVCSRARAVCSRAGAELGPLQL